MAHDYVEVVGREGQCVLVQGEQVETLLVGVFLAYFIAEKNKVVS